MTDKYRIGFACKYMHPDRTLSKKEISSIESPLNQRSTTLKWIKDNPSLMEERLWEIAYHNVASIKNLLHYVNTIEQGKMVRLSSSIFPLYTHDHVSWFYKQKTFIEFASKHLLDIGKYARKNDIRLSFHPGQFVVLASHEPRIVDNSIVEFEYHADMIRWLGYGKTFQDFKCNVHLTGQGGAKVFRESYKRLSDVAKNTITLENAEFGAGLYHVLALQDLCPIVLDIHHHWVRMGKYIKPDDRRIQIILDSWRGVRPTLHYAYSRQEILLRAGHDDTKRLPKPNAVTLDTDKRKLRAHSDCYPNKAANDWALSFLPKFDIMCESKYKNVASQKLINYYKGI